MIELCTGLGVACVSHQLFRNNRSMFLLVMTQVRMDCSWPVDVRVARSSGALRAIEGGRRVSRVLCSSLLTRSSTTLRTTTRAVSRVLPGIPARKEIRSATRWTSASRVDRNSGSSRANVGREEGFSNFRAAASDAWSGASASILSSVSDVPLHSRTVV